MGNYGNKKDLVLISSSFPFGMFETFLENEVPELVKYFNVFIVPSSASDKSSKRDLPDGATLLEWEDYAKPYRSFRSSVSNTSLLLSILSNEIHDNPGKRDFIVSNSRQWLQRLNFSSHRTKSIKTALDQYGLSNPVFYSYWLDDTALISVLLKRYYPGSCAISRTHGYDLYDERRAGNYQPFRDWLMKNLDGVFTASETGRKYLVENTRHGSKVNYSPLGTSDCGMAAIPETNDKPVIVSVANVVPLKRIVLLARALARSKVNLEWHHFGDGPELEEVIKTVEPAAPHLDARFHGRVSNRELMAFYSSNPVHCLISVSSSEGGVPVNLQEAASFGIPLIATDAGGSHELVTKNTGQRLNSRPSENDIIEALKQTMKEFSTNPEKRKKIREIWEKHFSAEINYRRFSNRVVELCAKGR